MLKKIKKVSVRDVFGLLIFLVVLIPSLIYKIYLRINKKELWLICENENMARDNGYTFYRYMEKKHPETKCYYAISFKCEDFSKFSKEDSHLIKWRSIKHYFYYMSATKNLSSHKEGNPNQTLFTILHLYLNLYNNRVFLQHGITKDDAAMFYYKNTKFKNFICGARREYEFISEKFGYPNENVNYTGFARFDNLHNYKTKNQILLIPTWRRWFELLSDEKSFVESEYYKKWQSVLNNEKLIKVLKKYKIDFVFYPHAQMKKFINSFKCDEKIKIINNEVDIQCLLKESKLMITDYSSVYMDFAYMKKPVAYYQFDYAEYRKSHFKEGYFSYENDGFGPVFNDEEKLVDYIIKNIENEFKLEKKYQKRMENFFEINDAKNCDRIYSLLKGCDNLEK